MYMCIYTHILHTHCVYVYYGCILYMYSLICAYRVLSIYIGSPQLAGVRDRQGGEPAPAVAREPLDERLQVPAPKGG